MDGSGLDTIMLTDLALRRLKPADKPFKVSDERGLYVYVTPAGSRLWRMNYRFGGRQKTLSFGGYPDVTLAAARERRDEARAALAAGRDPAGPAGGASFGEVSRAYVAKRRAEGVAQRTLAKLELHEGYLRAALGARPVAAVAAREVLDVLRDFEARGSFETARRLRALASRVFRYGVAIGACEVDPTATLQGAIATRRHTPHAALFEPAAVGALVRAVSGYDRPLMRSALRLLMLTMLRPGELRCGRWGEIVGDVWRVPAERMKMRREHLVPLSRQAREVLDELRPRTGATGLLFPGQRSTTRPISDNAMNAALRTMGYSVVAHGFRRTASTMLHEADWPSDWIERQLSHVDGSVRGVYNAAQHLEGRRKMLQWWANELDRLSHLSVD